MEHLLIKSELEKRLKKKRAEVTSLKEEIENFEDKIADRKYRIEVLEDAIREHLSLYNLLPSDAIPQITFRQNSDGALVHKILRAAGKPLYVDEILKQLDREIDVDSRASLAGQLGGYFRKGQVFTRPAPNTFGLREWDVNGHKDDPPDLSLTDEPEVPDKVAEPVLS